MWLSKNAAKQGGSTKTDATSCMDGRITISSGDVAAFSGCEMRSLALCTPGGFAWRPSVGEDVIIIKTAQGGGAVAGTTGADNDGLEAGEVKVYSNGCSICLKNSGAIEISGDVYINGRKLEV